MLHAKFQDHRISGSGEEDFFKGFYHIWGWRPSWSCDLDHSYKLWFNLSNGGSTYNLALISLAVSEEKKIFENGGRTDDADGRTPA